MHPLARSRDRLCFEIRVELGSPPQDGLLPPLAGMVPPLVEKIPLSSSGDFIGAVWLTVGETTIQDPFLYLLADLPPSCGFYWAGWTDR